MDTGVKFKFLKNELDDRIKRYVKKRDGDKRKAFGLKILSICFAATITILLGLKIDDSLTKIFQDIALVLGASITVLNAIEAFYDHRSLWIRRTVTLAKLYALRADLSYAAAGVEESELDAKLVDRFKTRYESILHDDLRAWLKLRQDTSTEANEKKE